MGRGYEVIEGGTPQVLNKPPSPIHGHFQLLIEYMYM